MGLKRIVRKKKPSAAKKEEPVKKTRAKDKRNKSKNSTGATATPACARCSGPAQRRRNPLRGMSRSGPIPGRLGELRV